MAFRKLSSTPILVINNQKTLLSQQRGILSALHIPGHLTKAAVSIVTPDLSHIDESISKDLGAIRANLTARNSPFHLESFVEQWNRMKALRSERQSLEIKRTEITQKMRQVESNQSTIGSSVDEIKQEGIKLRNKLKELAKTWYEVEEIAITRALTLPNQLHPNTPIEDDLTVPSSPTPPASSKPSVEVCSVDDVKFADHSPTSFYLRGKAARLELEWIRMFSKDWIDAGYHPISAPDFVRSLVIDGCGLPFNDSGKVLSLGAFRDHGGNLESGNGLHLVGGASLPAMVAFLTKTEIQEPFPLRLVSAGRCYHPAPADSHDDLTRTVQSSSIHLLAAMKNCPQTMYQEVTTIQAKIHDQLERLNVNYRTTALCARHLEPWVQYQSSIEAYSPTFNKFVQVANVTIIGEFISRRLSIYGPGKEWPGFVSSQALSVPKLLACCI